MDSLQTAKDILSAPKDGNYAQVALAYALIALVEEMRGQKTPRVGLPAMPPPGPERIIK